MSANKFVYLNPQNASEDLQGNDVGIIRDESRPNDYTVYFLRTKRNATLPRSHVSNFKIEESGDTFEYKVCEHLNTAEDFENNRHKKGDAITKRPSCRGCRKIKNGKKVSEIQKNEWNKNKPSFGDLFECPICQKTTIAGISKIVLDHNHKNGNVRGWICESCNTGIGRFDDDPQVIAKAMDWLNK